MSEINPRNFNVNVAGLTHQIWSLTLGEDETIALPLDPNAWKTAVAQKKPRAGDLIQVRAHDNSQYWSLFVQGCGPGWLKAAMVEQSKAMEVPELPADCPLGTKWVVGNRTYDVIRIGDKAVLRGGFSTKGEAVNWIADHLRKLAA